MKVLGSALLFIALLVAAGAAKADTIFDVSGTFLGGGTLSGTIDYNGTTFDAGDVFVTEGRRVFEFTTGAIAPVAGYPVTAIWAKDYNVFGAGYLDLFLNVDSLSNFTGASLCSLSEPCGTIFNTTNFNLNHFYPLADPLVNGSITPLAATPEPSGVILVGTGLLAIAAFMRRRTLSV